MTSLFTATDEDRAGLRGEPDPGTAADWEGFGFTPTTAEPWIKVGEVCPADAITMSDAGMTPAACARIRAHDPRWVSAAVEVNGRTVLAEDPAAISL